MLQQTTVKTVSAYYARFIGRWPDIESLAAATLQDVLRAWAGLGYYARARNLHACAKAVVAKHGGRFPEREEELRALPGIGTYTAAAIAAIAFDRPCVPVDGNVERVVARLFAIEDDLPAAKADIQRRAASLASTRRAGDFAQALMDLGATICTPKKPACVLCPLTDLCAARRRGDQETFPRKAPKVTGRLRRGAVFFLLREDGKLLVRTRPAKGLLGGMTEFPTTEWTADFENQKALTQAPRLSSPLPNGERESEWRRIPGVVSHVFTHFPLELTVFAADVPAGTPAPVGARWVPLPQLADEALPSVMRKVLAHALDKSLERAN